MNFTIFKPTKNILLVFSFFLLILVGAHIQSWGFCKDCGIDKPFLYDSISGIGFWVANVFLSLPIVLFLFAVPAEFGALLTVLYYYFLAAVWVFFLPYLVRFQLKKGLIIIGLFLSLVFIWDAGFFRTADDLVISSPDSPSAAVWLGLFILPFLVAIGVYGVIIIGGALWAYFNLVLRK